MDLTSNDFMGSVPTELFLLTDLVSFYVARNYRLTRTLTSALGALTKLKYLNWSDLSLNGTIPTEIGLLTALTYLGLHSNNIIGTIPSEVGYSLNCKG